MDGPLLVNYWGPDPCGIVAYDYSSPRQMFALQILPPPSKCCGSPIALGSPPTATERVLDDK